MDTDPVPDPDPHFLSKIWRNLRKKSNVFLWFTTFLTAYFFIGHKNVQEGSKSGSERNIYGFTTLARTHRGPVSGEEWRASGINLDSGHPSMYILPLWHFPQYKYTHTHSSRVIALISCLCSLYIYCKERKICSRFCKRRGGPFLPLTNIHSKGRLLI